MGKKLLIKKIAYIKPYNDCSYLRSYKIMRILQGLNFGVEVVHNFTNSSWFLAYNAGNSRTHLFTKVCRLNEQISSHRLSYQNSIV